jgi:hypothetical protein
MRRNLRWLALLSLLACGCGDGPRVVVRDVQSARNELVDTLLKVTDEASAKQVADTDLKKIQKRWEEGIRKRLEEYQNKIRSQEKGLQRNVRFKAVLEKGGVVTRDDFPTELQTENPEFFEAQDAEQDRADEIKATAKRLDSQLKRIGQLFEKLYRGSKSDVKGLIEVLTAAQVLGTRDQSNETDWGPPLRLVTVKITVVPLRKQKGATPE